MTVKTVAFADLLAPDAINARTATKDGLGELAASIAQKGLIQPLAVRPCADDPQKFEIIDGRRRYQALKKLIAEKKMSRKDEVPVIVRNEDDAEALETSLMANTVRLPMHPVDQHEVFARLIDEGRSEADVASRFGIDEKTVKRQLALGRLAEPIRTAWRKGKIDADAAKAFTIHPSHEVQTAAFERIKKERGGYSTWAVRRELTLDKVAAGNISENLKKRYLEAGGTITESLFDEDSYLDDGALVRKLQDEDKTAALVAARAKFEGQGWSWIKIADDLPHDWRRGWERLGQEFELTDEQLTKFNELEDAAGATEDEAEADRLQAEANAFEMACLQAQFTPEMKARTGVVLQAHWNGEVSAIMGLIMPSADGTEDLESAIDRTLDSGDATSDDGHSSEAERTNPPADDSVHLSGALITDLTTAQTDAARLALRQTDERVALTILVAALSVRAFETPAKVQISTDEHSGRPKAKAFAPVLSDALAGMTVEQLHDAIRDFVADSLDLIANSALSSRVSQAAVIGALDGGAYLAAMRERFVPEDFFKRAPRDVIDDAIGEMEEGGITGPIPDTIIDWKKGQLAGFAAENARKCGWLPEELRHPDYALLEPDEPAQRLTGKDAAAEQSSEVAA